MLKNTFHRFNVNQTKLWFHKKTYWTVFDWYFFTQNKSQFLFISFLISNESFNKTFHKERNVELFSEQLFVQNCYVLLQYHLILKFGRNYLIFTQNVCNCNFLNRNEICIQYIFKIKLKCEEKEVIGSSIHVFLSLKRSVIVKQ